MNTKLIKKQLILLLFVFSAVLPAWAQTTTSSIVGRVMDDQGPVAEALVVARNTATGATHHTFSGQNGTYRISGLQVGDPYDVKVDAMGYKSATVTGITTQLGAPVTVDITLRLSSSSLEEVVVSASALRSANAAGAYTNVDGDAIAQVPSSTRSLNDLLKLTPQSTVMGGGFAVGGGNFRGSSVTVDGASFNNTFGLGTNLPAGGTPLSLEAVEQMSIRIAPFDVRQSGFQGGAINVVTKHGTNEWHGSVYNYYTGSSLCGDRVGEHVLINNQSFNNQMGFTLSGPIVKDKLFFFVNAEYNVDNEAGATARARTDASQGYGDGSEYHRPTEQQMDSIRNFLVSNLDYAPGRYQGYSISSPDYKLLARLDWNINSNNHFYLRFNTTHNTTSSAPSSSMYPIGSNPTITFTASDGQTYTVNRTDEGRLSPYALYFESARYLMEKNFTSLAAELNSSLFEGRGSNILRATWSYQCEPRSYSSRVFPTVDILEPYGDGDYAMFTTFGLDPFTYNTGSSVHTLNVTDELTYTLQNHTLVGGLQFEYGSTKNPYLPGSAGWYVYDSWQSFVDDVTSQSASPVMFMIAHANLDDPTATASASFTDTRTSLYAQDEWTVNPRLLLTAGLRLEMPTYAFPFDNANKDFDRIAAENPNSSFAGLSTGQLPRATVNVSPRLGFEWDMKKDHTAVLRGGTGLFTGRIPYVWIVSATSFSNCLSYQYITDGTGIHFADDRADIINGIYADQPFQQQDLAASTTSVVLAEDLTMPTSWKSSLSADLQLPLGVKATFEGVYSLNYNEVVATTLGYTQSGTIQLPGEPEERPLYTSENILNQDGAVMHGTYLHNSQDLHGRYLSFSAQLRKEFGFGLNLSAAYTYSNSLSITDGNGDQPSNLAATSNVGDGNSPELGYSAYVSPHRVIAGASYTVFQNRRTATKVSLFYEGLNMAFNSSGWGSARFSYLIKNVSGMGTSQLAYIPTEEELEQMPFSSDDNRAEYAAFIADDSHLSSHRGEYSTRGAMRAPWHNNIDLKVCQEFYFNVSGRSTTLEIGLDVINLANLLNSDWGSYQILSSETILQYKNNEYTFTQPVWNTYQNLRSTYQLLLHATWKF